MFAGRDRPGWTHAGIRPLATGASWVSYFEVAHCADTLGAACALGANIAIPATHVPGVGWIAVCVDREGSRFGLMQPGP
jgi:predicted enzyme related to lactoylglutathione lyase